MEDVDFSVKVSIVEHSLGNEEFDKKIPSAGSDVSEIQKSVDSNDGILDLDMNSESAMDFEEEKAANDQEEVTIEVMNETEDFVEPNSSMEKVNDSVINENSKDDLPTCTGNISDYSPQIEPDCENSEENKILTLEHVENKSDPIFNSKEDLCESKDKSTTVNEENIQAKDHVEVMKSISTTVYNEFTNNPSEKEKQDKSNVTKSSTDTINAKSDDGTKEDTGKGDQCDLESKRIKVCDGIETGEMSAKISELDVDSPEGEIQHNHHEEDYSSKLGIEDEMVSRNVEDMDTDNAKEPSLAPIHKNSDEGDKNINLTEGNELNCGTEGCNDEGLCVKPLSLSGSTLEAIETAPLLDDGSANQVVESKDIQEDMPANEGAAGKREENEEKISSKKTKKLDEETFKAMGYDLPEEPETDVVKVPGVEEIKEPVPEVYKEPKVTISNEMKAIKDEYIKAIDQSSFEINKSSDNVILSEPEIDVERDSDMEISKETTSEILKNSDLLLKNNLKAQKDRELSTSNFKNISNEDHKTPVEINESTLKQTCSSLDNKTQKEKRPNEENRRKTTKNSLRELGKRVKIEMDETDHIVEVEMKEDSTGKTREQLKKRKHSESKHNSKKDGEKRGRGRETNKSKSESNRSKKHEGKSKEKKKLSEKTTDSWSKDKESVGRQKPEKRKSRTEGRKRTSRSKAENEKSKLKKEISPVSKIVEEYDADFVLDEMEKVREKVNSGKATWEEVLSYRMFDRRPWSMDDIYCHLRYDLDINTEDTVFLENVRISLQQGLKKWKYSNQIVEDVLIFYEECLSAELMTVEEILYLLKKRKPVVYDRRRFLFQRETFIIRSCLENISNSDKNVIEQNRDICCYFLYVQAPRFLATLVRRTQIVVEAFLKFSSLMKTPSCVL